MPERDAAPTFSIRTLGCKVNQVESERIAAELIALGMRRAAEADAHVAIVDSCTVTAEADAKVRKAVRRALAAREVRVVAVTGCLAALDPGALAALGSGVIVEADKSRLAARVASALGLSSAGEGARATVRAGAGFHSRAMVKVQQGCDAGCAYCVVPLARGGPRSETAGAVLTEVAALVDAGVREVVLTGTNIGRFDGSRGLAGLLEDVAGTGIERIRLSSIEPLDLTDEFLEVAARPPAFLPHLHVPLQSGSDRVLAEMGRHYGAEAYLARLAAARRALGPIAVTTDVLVGFPGETGAEARETLRVCGSAGFARMHVFRYSARPGTRAAELPGRVPADVLAARAAEARGLSERLSGAYRTARVGGRADVLVERVEAGVAEGTSEDYLKVRFSLAEVRVGDLVAVRLKGLEGTVMRAEAEC